MPAAALAGSSPMDTFPGLGARQQTCNCNTGGADLGRGAAELISSAVVGAPRVVTVSPCELVGMLADLNSPASCAYTEVGNC